jgi:predicted O-methyltransferase YrrM
MSFVELMRKSVSTLGDEGPRAVLKKARRRIRFFRDVAFAWKVLRSERIRSGTLDDGLDFAFGFAIGDVTITPYQVRTEIASLLELIEAQQPESVLEIGTHRGGTLFLLSRAASPHARLASIDLPGGAFGGGYDWLWVPLLRALPREGQTLKLIRADSHDPRTYEDARRWLGGQPLDCLLIDGDHRFEGVRQDFVTFGPLVRPGGLIAFHDIVAGPEERVGGVPEYWRVVRQTFETHEFVEDWGQGGYGIGVVRVPPGGITIDRTILETDGLLDAANLAPLE